MKVYNQAYFQAYYLKHKDDIINKQKKYQSENKDKISSRKKLEYIGRRTKKRFLKVVDELKKKFMIDEKMD